jgi:hypothetical protein
MLLDGVARIQSSKKKANKQRQHTGENNHQPGIVAFSFQ